MMKKNAFNHGKTDHGEKLTGVAGTVNQEAYENSINEIRKATEAANALLLELSRSLQQMDNSLDFLGQHRIEAKKELRDCSDCSLEKEVFSTLGYQVGSFHSYRSIDRDLKKKCNSLGYTRKHVYVTGIFRYYDAKECRKKINGQYELGVLILAPFNPTCQYGF